MSVITYVVMLLPPCQCKAIEHINKWLAMNDHEILRAVSDWAGGEKHFAANDIVAGAFNYLERDDFIEMLKSVPWDTEFYNISDVRVFFREEQETRFFERFPNDEKEDDARPLSRFKRLVDIPNKD